MHKNSLTTSENLDTEAAGVREVRCEAIRLQRLCPRRQVRGEPEGALAEPQPRRRDLGRMQAYCDTEPYRKALRKRAVWVEPLCGEAKEWHGSRR